MRMPSLAVLFILSQAKPPFIVLKFNDYMSSISVLLRRQMYAHRPVLQGFPTMMDLAINQATVHRQNRVPRMGVNRLCFRPRRYNAQE